MEVNVSGNVMLSSRLTEDSRNVILPCEYLLKIFQGTAFFVSFVIIETSTLQHVGIVYTRAIGKRYLS